MKNMLKQLKKNWIRVWLIVIIIVSVVFGTYAAYTEVSSVKRVVSTTTSRGVPFSSNCLKIELASYRLPSDEFSVTICNFDQNFPSDYCTSPIVYELEAELLVKKDDGTYENAGDFVTSLQRAKDNNEITQETYNAYISKIEEYSIAKTEDDTSGVITSATQQKFTSEHGYKVTFDSDTLATGKSNTDTYTVKIDPADLNQQESQFFVYVKAHPTGGGTLSNLESRLFAAKGKDAEASWIGSIQEELAKTVDGVTIDVDYDFYNYVISGSGVGSMDILWNPAYVEVNKFFLTEVNRTPGTINQSDTTATSDGNSTYGAKYANWKKITISVDSRSRSRYELQLYKVIEDQGLINPSSYIACEFTKTANAGS